MSTAVIAEPTREPRSRARVAGFFYLLTFTSGSLALLVHSKLAIAAGLLAGLCYLVVTILFYFIFAAADRSLSLVAAAVSLAACALGPLMQAHVIPDKINPLIFFGLYCLLIGYLIFQSTFLPRILGAGMMFAGLGWLTFFSPQLANSLSPYNFFPGILGEGSLTLWLVLKGVDEPRWKEQFKRGRRLL